MGFDEKEVAFAMNQTKLFEKKIIIEITTSALPEINYLNILLQAQITTEKINGGYKTTFKYISEENKGEWISDTSDTQEKTAVGGVWANKSEGLYKFLPATSKDDLGRNISTQIKDFLI